MRESSLLVIGGLGALAFIASLVARRWLPISEVVAFLAVGIALGPRGFDIISAHDIDVLRPVTAVALGAMVFLIGQRLRLPSLAPMWRTLVPMSVVGSAVTFGVTFVGLVAAGVRTPVAYLLAAIAPSTAPVTVRALVVERRAGGPFTEHLLAATALNNVAAALLFGLGAPFAFATLGHGGGASQAAVAFVQLLGAASALGVGGALVLRWIGPLVDSAGQRFLLVWVTLILAVGGARSVGTSVVITTLVMGAVLANTRANTAPLFDTIRTLDAPIFLIFFLVTGADVHVRKFLDLGLVGGVYIGTRAVGRVLGGWLGLSMGRGARGYGWSWRQGAAQLPYAGMAVGLASFTVEKATAVGAPGVGADVAAVILGAVAVFELLTPMLLHRVLDVVGESDRGHPDTVAVQPPLAG